jgi:excisionase family DNA binding protein
VSTGANPDDLTPTEAARYMSMKPRTFYRALKKPNGPAALRFSKRTVRYPKAELDAWHERLLKQGRDIAS